MARTYYTTQAYSANSVNKDIDIVDVDLVTISVSGTFVATLSFFVSDDGVAWYPIMVMPSSSTTGVTTATTTGMWRADVTPYSKLRVGSTAYTSGTATARIGTRVVQE